MAIKVTLDFGGDRSLELWVEGPHSAVGQALDALLGEHNMVRPVERIEIMPNVAMPKFERSVSYPYNEGDTTVIGPECFAKPDGSVISWKGANYVRQSHDERSLADKLADQVK